MVKRVAYVILYGTVCWQFGVMAVNTIWTSLLLQPDNETLRLAANVVLFPPSFWWMWRLVKADEVEKAQKAGRNADDRQDDGEKR